MNDRYLFRGKRVDNGEWVYGYYVQYPTNGPDGMSDDRPEHKICQTGYGVDWYEVDPDTVSQWTGLFDKNGVKVFEGDISMREIWTLRNEYIFCENYRLAIYNKKRARFEANWFKEIRINKQGDRRLQKNTKKVNLDLASYNSDFEIIGNKWDNPELLSV